MSNIVRKKNVKLFNGLLHVLLLDYHLVNPSHE